MTDDERRLQSRIAYKLIEAAGSGKLTKRTFHNNKPFFVFIDYRYIFSKLMQKGYERVKFHVYPFNLPFISSMYAFDNKFVQF